MSTQTESGGGGVGGGFNIAAGDMPERRNDLNGTANKQIDLQLDYEAETRRHDQRLIAMRHNLAAGDVNIPTFDLGPNAGRNLQHEYQTLYAQWQSQEVAINLHFSDQREVIRENGVTLVSEFERGGLFEVNVQKAPPTLSQEFQSASKDNSSVLDTARDQKRNLENQFAALKEHDKALTDITRDADIAQANDPNDHEAVAEIEGRVSEWGQGLEEINNFHEQADDNIREENSPHDDELDKTAWYEIAPQEFENDLPQDMKAALNEDADKDYWLDQDFEDGLDFEVAPEISNDHDNGNDGGHER